MSQFAWCVNICKIMVSPIEAINTWVCVCGGGVWGGGCGCVCVCVCVGIKVCGGVGVCVSLICLYLSVGNLHGDR